MAKIFFKISLVFLLLILFPYQNSIALEEKVQVQTNNSRQIINALNNLPFYFVENKGQVNEKVKFHLKLRGGSIYFTSAGIVYQFIRFKDEKSGEQKRRLAVEKAPEAKKPDAEVYDIRTEFVGVSPLAEIEGLQERVAKFSFFRGNDADKWVRGASSYGKVMYRELYPGVDLMVYGHGGRLKYDYRINPGGKVEAIAVRYDGIKGMRINDKGQLEIETEGGVIIEDAPLSYQLIDGKKVEVTVKYVIDEDHTLRFKVGEYRKDKELIIDPTLDYSTYLGGSFRDEGCGIAVDSSGNAYVTGKTRSSNFPSNSDTFDPGPETSWNTFVSKINSSGSSLIYSTILAGTNFDYGKGIAVDSSGHAYVVGYTTSTEFPTTPGAYDESHNGKCDVFISKLNSSGSSLIYSTFLGEKEDDYGNGIAVDSSGNAYVTGYTASTDFPTTPDVWDRIHNGGNDVFVARIKSSGTSLFYSTFLGGANNDIGLAIAIDKPNNAYITGSTASSNFPRTPFAYDTVYNGGEADAFITKLNIAGRLGYSTFLGGSDLDNGRGIAADSSGNAYVAGSTDSSNFPTTPGAYDTSHNGDNDCFITKMNFNGNNLCYSTFLGGAAGEIAYGIAIDSARNAYVTGSTGSSNFPTTADAYETILNGDHDVFMTTINSFGTCLFYSTFFGGSFVEYAAAIAVDSSGKAYITGETGSTDFPTTPGAYDETDNAHYDAFISKFAFSIITLNVAVGQGPEAASYVKDFDAYNVTLLKTFKAFGPDNANGEVSVDKGDVTGDGVPEIVVGERSTGASSYVRVFKCDGTLLWTFQAFGAGNANGMVNVAVGDVDFDGVGEIVVGQGPGGQSYVRIFEYSNLIPTTAWQAFGGGNLSGEVRVAAGQVAMAASVGQIITGQGHGGQSYVRVWDYGSPPTLRTTFQAFGAANASGGVDVGVGCFDGYYNNRELIVVGQGGPGETAAAPAGSYIRIFNEYGTLYKTYKAFGTSNTKGRVTVSAGQVDDDFADEIIVGQAYGGNSYWRIYDYYGTLLLTVKAFGASNTNGQVDVAGHR